MAGVKTTHAGYDTYSTKWKRCRDVVAGQDAIHKAGEAYLDKLKDQTSDDYKAYLKRAVFYNATWRTISGLTGMMFRKEPAMVVPKGIEPYLDDVTMSGMTFDTLARITAGEVLEVGRIGILVDHPPMTNAQGITLAAQERLGLRPTMQVYMAESITNWKYRRINNRNMLSMVVLRECVRKPKDEFEDEEVTQYRVLDLEDGSNLYRQRVFEIDKDGNQVQIGEDIYPLMNNKRLGYIPFVIVGTDGMDAALDDPPLIDLVDLNLSHYRTTADYEHGCHFTGLPTAVVTGYSPTDGQTLYIGSQAVWFFPDPQAKASYLEFTGQGLGVLEGNLDRKERNMAVLGARMLAEEKKQVETYGATQIKHTGENSVLSAIAIAVSQALEWALGVFSEWAGQSGEVSFEINREFMPMPLDAQGLTALVSAWQAGAISEPELFKNLQKGDVIDGTKTIEDHQAEIDTAPVAAPVAIAA